jgi:hypothetical protein
MPRRNCTFPAEYWKDHLQDWQFAVITVGGQAYNKQQALVFFNTQPKNTYIFIYEQVFTIANNILSGADPQSINQILVQMNRWLDEHPNGTPISDAEQNTGVYLARQIELYNLGFMGPGLCAGVQAVSTADVAYIPVEDTSTTPTLTPTPSQQAPGSGNHPLPPRTPTITPKPTRKPGGGGPAPTQPHASATSAPPAPTATKAPPPTSTKAPTKLPTPTSPPLATPVSTKPPTPATTP